MYLVIPLLKDVSDIVTPRFNQHTAVLSLDISATFDSISHRILLDRLHHIFDICGTALSCWGRVYFAECEISTMYILRKF